MHIILHSIARLKTLDNMCCGRCYFTIIQFYVVITLTQCFPDCTPSPIVHQHVSYEWTDYFRVNVTWQRPKGLDSDCQVRYRINDIETNEEVYNVHITTEDMVTSGKYTIKMIGNCKVNYTPENVTLNIIPLAVLAGIQNFTCSFYESDSMNCSWIPTRHITDLQVFYRLCSVTPTHFEGLNKANVADRNGCHLKHLKDLSTEDVCILLIGTVNGSCVMNTFKRKPSDNVKTPAPTLTIREEGDYLFLSWTPPNISGNDCWEYHLNYSYCNEHTEEDLMSKNTHNIPYDKRCQYKFQIKANFRKTCGTGGSDISNVLLYDRQVFPQPTTLIIIIIPIILSIFVILACYCLWRQRGIIFPVIPDPSAIKEMMNRSKVPKNIFGSLYIPEKEDVEPCTLNLLEV